VPRFAVPIYLIALLVLVAGCGGGGDDKEKADQTVRDFVKAVNTRDADTYCDDLITEDFREKSTFATGAKASESCKREMRAITDLHIKLVRIVDTKVDGDTATVTAVLGRSGQELKQKLKLKKEDGDWKLAGTG
jgi:ketosteroid isomerase-like protein